MPAIEAVSNYSSILSTTYQDFKDVFADEVTEDEWLWANSIVHARTFRNEGISFQLKRATIRGLILHFAQLCR